MGHQYKTLIAGLLAVAIAFAVAIPLGFWLRPRYSTIPDQVFGAIVVGILVGIAAGAMRLLDGPSWPAKKRQNSPITRPGPDIDPNNKWSNDGAGCRTGYELSFEDFRRLVSDPASQPVIAPLLRDWYRYEIVGQGPKTVVRSEEGHVISIRVLHNRIQIDPPKQYSVYQRAMDIWR